MLAFCIRQAAVLFAPCIAALVASTACASAVGGEPLITVRTEVQPLHGVRIPRPDVFASAGGVRIRGSVCRTGVAPVRTPSVLRVEHTDAVGRVLDFTTARPVGDTWGRGPGCAYFDLKTSWAVKPSDIIRIMPPGAQPQPTAVLRAAG